MIRDGAIVRVKFCPGCSQEKRVSDAPRESEFPLNGRRPDGRVRGWKPICKKCFARRAKERRDQDPEAARRYSREVYRRLREDPEWAAFRRDYLRAYSARRRKEDPEFVERTLRRSQKWRQRKREEDPGFFSDARRAERLAAAEPSPLAAQGTQPRIPVEPFCRWLEGYAVASGIGQNEEELSRDLGLISRTLRYALGRKQARVEADVVDRALMNSRHVVCLDGRAIVTINDLYGEYLEANPGTLG